MKQKQTFEEWKKQVDDYIATELMGLTGDDLPDFPYRNWYDDGAGPNATAKAVISNAKES